MAGEIKGHIDCPTCGTKGGMRITLDKNGDPFGFCEATCSQQMRIGGSPDRVRRFLALYPWASVQALATEKAPEQVQALATEKEPLPLQEKPPAKRGFSMGL